MLFEHRSKPPASTSETIERHSLSTPVAKVYHLTAENGLEMCYRATKDDHGQSWE